MPVTPDVIINKPRKFLHDALTGAGMFTGLYAALAAVNDAHFIVPALISVVSFYLGSKIKYKTVKTAQIDQYKRV